MQPRFPPRGTPEYLTFLEDWLIKERVDNERQWRLLRQVTALLTGLDPIQDIYTFTLPDGTGSGSGSGSSSGTGSGCVMDCLRVTIAGLSGYCARYNGVWYLSRFASNVWIYSDHTGEGVELQVSLTGTNSISFNAKAYLSPGGGANPGINDLASNGSGNICTGVYTMSNVPISGWQATCGTSYTLAFAFLACPGSGSGSGTGSGTGSGSGSGSGSSGGCECTATTKTLTISGVTGGFSGYNGSYTLTLQPDCSYTFGSDFRATFGGGHWHLHVDVPASGCYADFDSTGLDTCAGGGLGLVNNTCPWGGAPVAVIS